MAQVGLFFYVDGSLLWHGCALRDGEANEDFVNYPYSHMEIWDNCYLKKYQVDFDYYPRGRIVYRKTDDMFLVYHDSCIPEVALAPILCEINRYSSEQDEHYTCHKCCDGYVTL